MASQDGVYLPGQSITDANGNVWSIIAGQVAVNGKVDPTTNRVIRLAFENGLVWQQNTDASWFFKKLPGDAWSPPQITSPVPFTVSPDNTVVTDSSKSITDAFGNTWSIINGQVALNGVPDPTTNRVTELAYENGEVWQENADHFWFSKQLPTDPWSQGTLTSPIPSPTSTTLTWIGGGNNNSDNPADWKPNQLPKPADKIDITPGTTLNINSNVLDGHDLNLIGTGGRGNDTINVLRDSTFDVGSSSGPVQGTGTIAINLSAMWIGGISLGSFSYAVGATIRASGNAAFTNTSSMIMQPVLLDADVGGTGTFTVLAGHSAGNLEFAQSVAATQTVNIGYGGYGTSGGIVQIDDPKNYHASTVLGFGEVEIKGISADSYALQNDVLTLFKANTVVDTMSLRIDSAPVNGLQAQPLRVDQQGSDIFVHTDFTINDKGTPLPVHSPQSDPPPQQPSNFTVTDLTTGVTTEQPGEKYTGPVEGIDRDIILITQDNLNVISEIPNVFIHTDRGVDGLNVQASGGGSNILDGGSNSNFLTGGSGNDTFYVDDRSPAGNVWSSVLNFHSGDMVTVWGISKNDFSLSILDNQGATALDGTSFKGLTFGLTAPNHPDANLTLVGRSSADISSGRLQVSFGHSPDTPGLPGSDYMQVLAT